MANRKFSGNTYKGAIIDTAPGAGGYWTEGVKSTAHKVHALILSISGIWSGTVVLQFKEKDAPGWTTYRNSDGEVGFISNTRQIVEDYTNCEWRAGVAYGGYTSGAVRVRLEYHNGEYK